MPDYKKMYVKMFQASEQAVNILIAAQRECGELYLSSPQPELQVIPAPLENRKGLDKAQFPFQAFFRPPGKSISGFYVGALP